MTRALDLECRAADQYCRFIRSTILIFACHISIDTNQPLSCYCCLCILSMYVQGVLYSDTATHPPFDALHPYRCYKVIFGVVLVWTSTIPSADATLTTRRGKLRLRIWICRVDTRMYLDLISLPCASQGLSNLVPACIIRLAVFYPA